MKQLFPLCARLVVVLFSLLALAGCAPAPAQGGLGASATPASSPSASVAPITVGSPVTTPVPAAPPETPTSALAPTAASPVPGGTVVALPTKTVAPEGERAGAFPTAAAPEAWAVTPVTAPASQPTGLPAATPTESDALRRDPRLARAPTPTPTPGPTPDGARRTVRAPILMFHYISEPPPGADAIRTSNSVAPALFESYLRYLSDAGFHVVSLDDLLYALVQGRPLPPKPVVLTFDDGYADNFANAFPLLQRYEMTGTFFLITDFVSEGRPEYMTWDQVKLMSEAGQRFGSHTRNHPDLRGKPLDYLVWQALGGTEAIQEHLGYHPHWIAYPSGKYDDQATAVFKSANYWGGVTTDPGATHSSDQLFTLTRVRIFGYYSVSDLARLLSGGE